MNDMVGVIDGEALDVIIDDTRVAKITNIDHHGRIGCSRREIHPRQTMLQPSTTRVSITILARFCVHDIIVTASHRLSSCGINLVL